MIELRHVKKSYGPVTPFSDINAVIGNGEVISVIGPSGCGKSTLLRCINMLDPPTSGDIIIDGEEITAPGCNIPKLRRKVGMVFQSFNLFGHMTAIENVMAPQMEILGRTKQEAYDKACDLLRTVGLSDRAMNYPDELSGGQKQRVAIARALAMDPEIILFDEPTSALDPTMVGEVQNVIKKLADEGHTMMIVTHEMKFAREIANRVFYLDEGGIYEDGTPEQIFGNPQKEKTQRFIKRLKAVDISIDSRDFDWGLAAYRLEEFGFRNRIAAKDIYRIQSVFEEICENVIMPGLPEEFSLAAAVLYSDDTGETTMNIKYSGPDFDPLASDNDIALAMIRGMTKETVHESLSDGTYTNRVTVRF